MVSYSINLGQLAVRLKLSITDVAVLFSYGVTVVLGPTRLKLVRAGTVERSLDLGPKTAEMLASGGIVYRPAMQKKVTAKLAPMIGDLIADYVQGHAVQQCTSEAALAVVQAEATVTEKPQEAPAQVEFSGGAVVTAAEMQSLEPIPLFEATRLYEPVRGTSPGTRYFVVGIGDGVKIAARMGGNKLSLRVEGEITPHTEKLVKMGFGPPVVISGTAGQRYSSIHLGCPTADVAAKTLGAVLIGLGFAYTTPPPVFARIAG